MDYNVSNFNCPPVAISKYKGVKFKEFKAPEITQKEDQTIKSMVYTKLLNLSFTSLDI